MFKWPPCDSCKIQRFSCHFQRRSFSLHGWWLVIFGSPSRKTGPSESFGQKKNSFILSGTKHTKQQILRSSSQTQCHRVQEDLWRKSNGIGVIGRWNYPPSCVIRDWFQQDGAIYHVTAPCLQFLSSKFGVKLISRRTDHHWPH